MAKPHRKPTQPDREQNAVRLPAGAPRWITVELIEHTLRVWQPYYEQTLSAEEALEIVMGMGRIVDVFADDG